MVMNKQISIGQVIKLVIFVVTLSGMWYSNQHQVDLLEDKVERLERELHNTDLKVLETDIEHIKDEVEEIEEAMSKYENKKRNRP
jgi:Tfp pilus assembly protein PilO